ncbi:hypothetical protein BDW22DRAFT_1068013 [Trametopsis cervina]|nr:hypothetical protein BDW22DRAFT_1068013 [Trametopsis cervina]
MAARKATVVGRATVPKISSSGSQKCCGTGLPEYGSPKLCGVRPRLLSPSHVQVKRHQLLPTVLVVNVSTLSMTSGRSRNIAHRKLQTAVVVASLRQLQMKRCWLVGSEHSNDVAVCPQIITRVPAALQNGVNGPCPRPPGPTTWRQAVTLCSTTEHTIPILTPPTACELAGDDVQYTLYISLHPGSSDSYSARCL